MHRCKECNKQKAKNWHYDNHERSKEARRAYSKNNPETVRRLNYKRKYGITLEQYNQILEAQGGVCAGCGGVERRAATGNLAVDHNHETGEVRGLLCSNCNRALGLLGDSIETLKSLADYLS